MKKIILGIIIIITLTNGCGIQDNEGDANSHDEEDIIVKPTSIDNDAKTELEANLTDTNHTNDSDALTQEVIKEYLGMKMSEILNEIGGTVSVDNGTLSIMKSHMFFPSTFSKELGISFIFPNDFEDLTPIYLLVTEESNIKNINVLGAKPGMDFNEIRGKLGDIEVTKTWIANEDNVAYELYYQSENVEYRFLSYDEQGTDSVLYISLPY